MQEHHLEEYNGFEKHQKILYKVSLIYNQKLFRLCLPSYLGQEVISKLHYMSEAHLSLNNLICIKSILFHLQLFIEDFWSLSAEV